jgi:hypothetical protein
MVMTNFGSWKTLTSRTSWLFLLGATVSVAGLAASFEGCTNGATVTCGADAGCGTGVFFSDAAMTDGGATDTASEGATVTDAPAGDAPGASDTGTDSGDDAATDAGSTDAASSDAPATDAPATDAPVDSPTQG